jgi:hypothetical protein
MSMSRSWLRQAVDRVLAEAPHMSDAHKRKLVEAVGLELVRARGVLVSSVSGILEKKSLHDFAKLSYYNDLEFEAADGEVTIKQVTATCPSCRCEHNVKVDIAADLERERARTRFELRRSYQPNRGRDG